MDYALFITQVPVRLWNSLPCEIRDSPSLPVFRKNIKTHILENYKS